MLSSNSLYRQMNTDKQQNGQTDRVAVVEEINKGFKILASFFAICMLGVAIFTVLRVYQHSQNYSSKDYATFDFKENEAEELNTDQDIMNLQATYLGQ